MLTMVAVFINSVLLHVCLCLSLIVIQCNINNNSKCVHVQVDAPWLKQFFYADYDTYIVPNSKGIVTLGGCRHYDSHHTNFCEYDKAAILERCYKLVPRLKEDRIIKHWVGLRPHRDPVRVEVEQYGQLKVRCT